MVPILVLQLLMDMDDSSDDDIDYLAGSIYTDEMDSEEIETETDSMDTLPNPDSPSAESVISVSDETEDEEDALPRPESPGEDPPLLISSPHLPPPANEPSQDPSPLADQLAEVPAPVAEKNAAPGINTSTDEDGQTCTICFELWTNSSEHRLVSLRCGHLFGRSCITRWLKGQARCPQCNARARKSEIRNIYAKSVKVIDSSERDKALQDLTKEIELRRRAEISATQERLKHMMAVQEAERLKKELMEANRLLQEYRSGSKTSSSSSSSQAKKSVSLFRLEKCVDVSKSGGCRIVDSCELLGMLLVSSPSSNELFQGYGFRKISTHDMKPAEFVLVHQKLIKDMAFHAHDGLVLTASIDKTLKITNVLTNSIVQTYNLEADVWSCTWDNDDPMYFYGGLKTGEVCVFDIRVTSRHVHMLPDFGAKTPVVSLQYLKSPGNGNPRKYGPLVGKLSNCALQQKAAVFGEYKSLPLPSLGPFTSVSANNSGNFLISCRPSPKQPCVSHTLCEFVSSYANELICNPLQTVLGGRSQLQLTKSKLLKHPENESSLLICAGDEDARSTLIWDGSSGNQIAQLPAEDSPVLDFASLKINHSSFLTALTDKTLRLYSWTGQ